MAFNVQVNGVTYQIPNQGDNYTWGTQVSSWIQAMSTGVLQKSGGLFALTSTVDFGASFGIKSSVFSGRGVVANSGLLRLATADQIVWAGDYSLGANAISGFLRANTGFEAPSVIVAGANVALSITAAYGQANAAYGQANLAYAQANTAYANGNVTAAQVTLAYGQANAAFNAANASNLSVGTLLTKSGNTINVNVAGAYSWTGSQSWSGPTTFTSNSSFSNISVSGTITGGGLVSGSNGSFTGTFTGFSTTVTQTVVYRIVNGICFLTIGPGAGVSGTSNSTSMSMTGLPSACQPSAGTGRNVPIFGLGNNGSAFTVHGSAVVQGSTIGFSLANGSPVIGTSFTASGTKGLSAGTVISYSL